MALILDISEDKLPDLHVQIVKGLAQHLTLFDHDKELLVLNTTEDRDAILELLEYDALTTEEINLLLLPPDSELYLSFSDYGFISKAERHYLYEHLVSIFRFSEQSAPLAEATNALLQMQEHLIAYYLIDSVPYYAVDRQFIELIEGIAIAYKCSVLFKQ